MSENAGFRQWCIVELFGHSQIAGEVFEQRIGDTSFVRIDVPAVNGQEAYSKLYGEKAIYSITPTNEEIVKRFLNHCSQPPINPYYIRDPKAPALPEPDQFEGNNFLDDSDE